MSDRGAQVLSAHGHAGSIAKPLYQLEAGAAQLGRNTVASARERKQMAPWAGPVTLVIIAVSASLLGYYQFFYAPLSAPASTPESEGGRSAQLAKVSIVEGASTPNSERNFVPKVVTVLIGVNNTVEWTNDEGVPHTVTSDAHGGFNKPTPDPQFDAAATNQNWLFDAGSKWSFTFRVPGTYTYHCAPHPWMTGTVVVKAGA